MHLPIKARVTAQSSRPTEDSRKAYPPGVCKSIPARTRQGAERLGPRLYAEAPQAPRFRLADNALEILAEHHEQKQTKSEAKRLVWKLVAQIETKV